MEPRSHIAYLHLDKKTLEKSSRNIWTSQLKSNTRSAVTNNLSSIYNVRNLIWTTISWKWEIINIWLVAYLGVESDADSDISPKLAAEIHFKGWQSSCYYIDTKGNNHRQVQITSSINSKKKVDIQRMWSICTLNKKIIIHIMTEEWEFCIGKDDLKYSTYPNKDKSQAPHIIRGFFRARA